MPTDPLRDPRALIRRIYSYVAYRVGDGAEAEDITSEVFERAIRYRSSYDPARGEPVSWLVGIARRCIDDAAALGSEPPSATLDLADPADLEGDALRRLIVARALARLEQRDRDLLALKYGADLPTREIASVLELTGEATDVALHRARKRLRDELAREGERPSAVEPRRSASSGPGRT
jgi:RNA polymerase sigma factor (sigma-70 family)